MKKSFSYLVFMIVFMFISVLCVNASYTCGYYGKNGHNDVYIDYTVRDDGTVVFKTLHGPKSVIDVMDYSLDSSYNGLSYEQKNKKLVKFMDGKCERSVYVCQGYGISVSSMVLRDDDGNEHVNSANGSGYSVLFDLQFSQAASDYKGIIYSYNGRPCTGANWLEEHDNQNLLSEGDSCEINNCENPDRRSSCLSFYEGHNTCLNVDINEDTTTGEIVSGLNSDKCDYYDNKLDSLEQKYADCKNKSLCYDYNSIKNEIRSFCNFTLQYTNYNNPCLNSCFKLGDKIAEIENTNFGGSTCNVSDKIWKWITNILKWVKYFAPVLVIVLGIIDFIKAIASQSDDEMKKAQGRFVKRLIAAVLLFVIPFLIEFALNAFHLVTDNPYCSLI